jgi:enamine deaminase RidA (YjgF/YER057c/UK114 family)
VTIRLVRTDRLYAGVPYAYASVTSPAALVFTAGACPLDRDGAVAGQGDVRAQARQAVANLAEALDAAGSSMSQVLKTTIYVASAAQGDLVAAWEEISAVFGEHDVPSTLIRRPPGQAAALAAPGGRQIIRALPRSFAIACLLAAAG